jgi:hypothetical protein
MAMVYVIIGNQAPNSITIMVAFNIMIKITTESMTIMSMRGMTTTLPLQMATETEYAIILKTEATLGTARGL